MVVRLIGLGGFVDFNIVAWIQLTCIGCYLLMQISFLVFFGSDLALMSHDPHPVALVLTAKRLHHVIQ